MPRLLLTMMTLIFPDHATVLMRHPLLQDQPQRFEQMVALACAHLKMDVEWCVPEPGGRHQVYFRDVEMVGKSDLVLAWFATDQMTGGTEHVVEKAIDQRVPVYSYGIRDASVVMLGSHDPDNAFGQFTI